MNIYCVTIPNCSRNSTIGDEQTLKKIMTYPSLCHFAWPNVQLEINI